MGRQLNIRSDRAYELATRLAADRNTTVARVVEEALEGLQVRDQAAQDAAAVAKLARWTPLLEEGWRNLDPSSDFKIEDLYDPETGLPA